MNASDAHEQGGQDHGPGPNLNNDTAEEAPGNPGPQTHHHTEDFSAPQADPGAPPKDSAFPASDEEAPGNPGPQSHHHTEDFTAPQADPGKASSD